MLHQAARDLPTLLGLVKHRLAQLVEGPLHLAPVLQRCAYGRPEMVAVAQQDLPSLDDERVDPGGVLEAVRRRPPLRAVDNVVDPARQSTKLLDVRFELFVFLHRMHLRDHHGVGGIYGVPRRHSMTDWPTRVKKNIKNIQLSGCGRTKLLLRCGRWGLRNPPKGEG